MPTATLPLTAGSGSTTLAAADSPSGLAFHDPVTVDSLDEQEPLDCAPDDQPFRLRWLAEGRCTRPEVDGVRVVLEVE